MASFEMCAKISEIPEGTAKAVTVKGHEIALFNIGGKVCAIENSCTHQGGPLAEGTISGNVVTCPWHNWQFDVTNGKCMVVPDEEVRTFPAKLDGEKILVEV